MTYIEHNFLLNYMNLLLIAALFWKNVKDLFKMLVYE